MSAKFGARRKAAFLAALAESGNQTLAAERAKVSRSWVCLHRSTDAAFDAACIEAIAQAKASLGAIAAYGGSRRPAEGWRFAEGAELVVRGTNGRRTQIARSRLKQWTARVETRFLSALAASCNVKAACAEVGTSFSSAYAHRARWPGFARRWDEAVETGTARIEAALIENACHFLAPADEPPPEAPLREMSVADAIRIVEGRPRRRGADRE